MIRKITFFRNTAIMLLVFLCTSINNLYAQAATITSHPRSTSACAGTIASFSVGATGAITYQWEVSTDGVKFIPVSNGGVYINANIPTLIILGPTADMDGYQYRCKITGITGAVTSDIATLTVISTNTWTGNVSNTWSVPSNWSCGSIPSAAIDVLIPSGTKNSPQIDITTAICNNITISSGATLSYVMGTNVLEVKGDFINNGTFSAVAGKLRLSGNGPQAVPGGTYKEIELNGSGTKTASGAINISGALTLTNGYLLLGANDLTLGNAASIGGNNAVLLNLNSTSHIITNSTGRMRIQNIDPGGRGGSVLFPIGVSASSYTPLTIRNTGTVDMFSARVRNGVYTSYDASGNPNGPVQNTYNVNKTWLIYENTPGGSNANINFAWSSDDEQPGFNNGMCWSSHWWDGYWHSAPGAAANGFDPYNKALNNVTSFSPFAIGSQFSILTVAILPVDLVSFTGKPIKNGNVLSWVTANEKSFSDFYTERSADGRNFERIATVPAQVQGNSSEKQYDYTDAHPLPGNNYYRLRMNDLDGQYKYSDVLVINNNNTAKANYTLYPNPVQNEVNIRFSVVPVAEGTITVTDVVGRVRLNAAFAAGSSSLRVNVKMLPQGIYQLRVNNGAIDEVMRFAKQ